MPGRDHVTLGTRAVRCCRVCRPPATPTAASRVFALRADTYETVTMFQKEVNGDWIGRWDSIGNPNAGGAAPQVGLPAATINQDGRIQIFQKNGGGGVSTAYQKAPNDEFSGWVDLGGGPGIQDGLAATINPQGRIELFAYAIESGVGSWVADGRARRRTSKATAALVRSQPPTRPASATAWTTSPTHASCSSSTTEVAASA